VDALGGAMEARWAVVSFEGMREEWLNDESSLVFA